MRPMEPKTRIPVKEVLADLAFTAGAALATGGIVSALAVAMIVLFAS